VNIDHHHDNTRFGDIDLVVDDASSTAEVLADVFVALGIELTPAIAEALYTAARHGHGPFPVLEHDAQGAPSGRSSSSRQVPT
jgi:phosphoesterase RecJ-like protein